MHCELAAKLDPQPLVGEKAVGLAPVIDTLEIESGALPVLDSVAVIDPEVVPNVVAGKATGLGERVAIGAGTGVPVPVRVAVWGEPTALSATLSVAVKVVAESGVKKTWMLQLRPMPRLEPQAVASTLKSPGLAPMIDTLEMLNAAVPGLESTTVIKPLVVFTVCGLNGTSIGLSIASGIEVATAVPFSWIV